MTPGTPDAPRLPCKTLRRSLSSTAPMNTSRTTRRAGKTVHRHQWGSTLKTYVHPVIGHLPVAGVDTGLVLKILPIWKSGCGGTSQNSPVEVETDLLPAAGVEKSVSESAMRARTRRDESARSAVTFWNRGSRSG